MKVLMIYIPFSDEESALKFIEFLLEEKLIACGNVIQSKSAYFWKENMCNESEYIAILKTLPNHLYSIESRVKTLHSYDLPAILSWEVEANLDYYEWVKSQVP